MESTVESFRDIPGLPRYQVSNHGNIRRGETGQLRSLHLTTGYPGVTVWQDRKRRRYLVHRLLMLAFVGVPPHGHTVDHIDRNRSNNHLLNLRYITTQEQAHNRSRRLTLKRRGVERIGPEEEVVLYDSVIEAAHSVDGIADHMYKAIGRGRQYMGFTWRYVKDVPATAYVWKSIPPEMVGGVTGYAASTCGHIRLLNGSPTRGTLTSGGYRQIGIKGRAIRVHRLIALTFLTCLRKEGNRVNHKDGDKSNNAVENLEFVTLAENSAHAHRTGLITIKSQSIKQFTVKGDFVREYASAREAGQSLKGSPGVIRACCSGGKKSAYGFVWKYSETPPSTADS